MIPLFVWMWRFVWFRYLVICYVDNEWWGAGWLFKRTPFGEALRQDFLADGQLVQAAECERRLRA